jgi:hypothetical protein
VRVKSGTDEKGREIRTHRLRTTIVHPMSRWTDKPEKRLKSLPNRQVPKKGELGQSAEGALGLDHNLAKR